MDLLFDDQFLKIPNLEKIDFFHFSVGEYHTIAVSKTSELYGWGNCDNGKLGTLDPD
jgi:alpha-tubulin suppressor-like RCC1 family protein